MSHTLPKVATRALLVIVILGLAAWTAGALYLGPYELGRLDTRLPFEELRRRSHINAAAQAADQAADSSQRIRAGLPKPAAGDSHK